MSKQSSYFKVLQWHHYADENIKTDLGETDRSETNSGDFNKTFVLQQRICLGDR
jgi:hypothetical protein